MGPHGGRSRRSRGTGLRARPEGYSNDRSIVPPRGPLTRTARVLKQETRAEIQHLAADEPSAATREEPRAGQPVPRRPPRALALERAGRDQEFMRN